MLMELIYIVCVTGQHRVPVIIKRSKNSGFATKQCSNLQNSGKDPEIYKDTKYVMLKFGQTCIKLCTNDLDYFQSLNGAAIKETQTNLLLGF